MSTLNKYIWVVNALHRVGDRGLSLKELNEKWERSDISNGNEQQRQTFDHWKGKILEMMGVTIDCNLKEHRHALADAEACAAIALKLLLWNWHIMTHSINH